MRRLGLVCMECADKCEVPAGGALAVDRDIFSALITERIENDPNITLVREEITEIPESDIKLSVAEKIEKRFFIVLGIMGLIYIFSNIIYIVLLCNFNFL